MKIPDNIKKAIKECAEANNKAKFNERTIIKWLEEHKLTEYCVENNIYERSNNKILYDIETDSLEIEVQSI